ncbi:HNH endonuclease [Paenibacillus sp. FSL R5-0407]|uniref:HNH endonuclease n=1 Tax=Paenibacillus sp. FSL R5-0407 TaxID=2975320 RepID=UPI0030FA6149
MKLNESIEIFSDERAVHICDQCEERTIGPLLYWKERDFTLCSECVQRSYDLLFQPSGPTEKTKTKKKQAIPAKLKKDVFERDGYRCRYCGSFKDLTADHIFPESRGGTTTFENLATACSNCNTKKGARTPEEAGMFLNEGVS